MFKRGLTGKAQLQLAVTMALGCFFVAALAAQTVRASSGGDSLAAHEPLLLDIDGNRRTLDDFRGKVLLINFWTSWCPPCKKEMPALARLSRAMVGQPFALIAVNVAEGRGIAQRFAALETAGIALLRDVNADMAKQWGVEVYPTSFIVDGEGRTHETIIGETDWDAQARHDQLNALIRATAKRGTD